MELRSQAKELKELLKAAGVYDDSMDLEEMRQVAQAMEISANSTEAVECMELERALLESEIDFQLLFNSTMILDPEPAAPAPCQSTAAFSGSTDERDCESPPCSHKQLEVRAVVHHELNWSPSNTTCPAKRPADENNSYNVIIKRTRVSEIPERQSHSHVEEPVSVTSSDSGLSCDEIGTLSSISEHSTLPSIGGEMPSRLLISTSSAVVSDFSDCNRSSL